MNEQKHYLIGKQYEAQKMAVGGNGSNQNAKNKEPKSGTLLPKQEKEEEHSPESPKNSRTAEKVAKEHGVGKNTVKEDEKFAKGVDEAEKLSPGMTFLDLSTWKCQIPPGCLNLTF